MLLPPPSVPSGLASGSRNCQDTLGGSKHVTRTTSGAAKIKAAARMTAGLLTARPGRKRPERARRGEAQAPSLLPPGPGPKRDNSWPAARFMTTAVQDPAGPLPVVGPMTEERPAKSSAAPALHLSRLGPRPAQAPAPGAPPLCDGRASRPRRLARLRSQSLRRPRGPFAGGCPLTSPRRGPRPRGSPAAAPASPGCSRSSRCRSRPSSAACRARGWCTR